MEDTATSLSHIGGAPTRVARAVLFAGRCARESAAVTCSTAALKTSSLRPAKNAVLFAGQKELVFRALVKCEVIAVSSGRHPEKSAAKATRVGVAQVIL